MFAQVNRSLITEKHNVGQLEENKQRSDGILFILKDHSCHNLENGKIITEGRDYN